MPRPVFDILISLVGHDRARTVIQELWGSGWSIVERQNDPFALPSSLVPDGMAYQWMPNHDVQKHAENGWAVVPAERHDGYFAPTGYVGDAVVGGMTLMERPKADVEAAHAGRIAKAHKNVEDWTKRVQADGFIGNVNVAGGGEVKETTIGGGIETRATKLPDDMWPHVEAVFSERDRLRSEAKGENADMAEITKVAIANVRARLSAEKETAA